MKDEAKREIRRIGRLFLILCALATIFGQPAAAAQISFDLPPEVNLLSGDLSELGKIYQPRVIENAKDYGLPADARLIQSDAVDQGLRLMLAGGGLAKTGRYSSVWLLLLQAPEKRGGKEKVLQRLSLGAGEAPQMRALAFAGGRKALFFRVMREGFNVEAFVFYLKDAKAPKLIESLRVDRNFPLRMRLNIKGTLQQDGFVNVVSAKPEKNERLDLSDPSAADGLIAERLYQPDGQPIPALRNLVCARTGYEGVEVVNGKELRVGLSLVSSSKKTVVDATVSLESEDGERWAVSDVVFEPSLPFRSE